MKVAIGQDSHRFDKSGSGKKLILEIERLHLVYQNYLKVHLKRSMKMISFLTMLL